MTKLSLILAASVLLGPSLLFSGCSSPDVQETRMSGIENRQDRIDSRTEARLERRRVRSEREDARAEARFNAW